MIFNAKKHKSLGRFLKEKRKDLEGSARYFTVQDAMTKLGYDPSMGSKIESGLKDSVIASKWQARQQYDLLITYQCTEDEIREISEIFNLQATLFLAGKTKVVSKNINTVPIRYMGSVQAGRFGKAYANDAIEYIEVDKSMIGDYDKDDCMLIDVDGNSMTSDDVKRTIPEGSSVIFHRLTGRMTPQDGEIVLIWLEKENIGVIKTFHKQKDFVVLESYNGSHIPIIIDERNNGIIQGVYLSHQVKSWRLKR